MLHILPYLAAEEASDEKMPDTSLATRKRKRRDPRPGVIDESNNVSIQVDPIITEKNATKDQSQLLPNIPQVQVEKEGFVQEPLHHMFLKV